MLGLRWRVVRSRPVALPTSTLVALAREPALRRASLALALYRLAEFGPWVAMLVYAYDQGGATATGLVSLGLLVPTAIVAPFAGPLIDRFGASRVLVAAYAAQALTMGATAVALLTGSPSALVYVLGAFTATTLTVTHPAHAVVSPGLSRTTEQLVALNAVTGWVLSLGLVLAPALAGVVLAVSTPGAVYAAGAALLALSALLVMPLRDQVPPLARGHGAGAGGALRQLDNGARALIRTAAPREVVLVLTATFMMVGAFDVLAVTLAIDTLGIGGSGAAYLTAAHGAGAVLGAVASFGLIGRARLVPVIVGAAVLAGVAFVVLGIATTLGIAFAVAAVTGISRSLLEVTGQTLLQRVTTTSMLARVFAFKEGLAMAAWGVGSAAVPLVIALAGTTGALLFAGAIVPGLVLLRLRLLLAVDAAVTVPVVTIALLRSMRVLRALPVPALEGVAQEALEVTVAAGDTILRQGDAGDQYYAIADGTVEVSRDGQLLAQLARGEGFGEIALLRDGVRTATVVATTDARLIVVRREPFLVAVTGHGETQAQFEDVAEGRLSGR
jgi:Cyclic nucleotide-binding domain/Major Facilitator Superfamily